MRHLFWNLRIGNSSVKSPLCLTPISAEGAEGQSGGTPVVFQCWGAGKQDPPEVGRWPRPADRQAGIRRPFPAAQGVASPAWSAGGGDHAGLQPCLLQPTRCSGRHHDAGISHSTELLIKNKKNYDFKLNIKYTVKKSWHPSNSTLKA